MTPLSGLPSNNLDYEALSSGQAPGQAVDTHHFTGSSRQPCVPSPTARPSRRASWSVPVEETLDSLISVQETLFITVLSHRATPRTAAQVGLGVRRGADREEPVRVGPGAVWPQL